MITLINLEFLVIRIIYNVFILKLIQGREEFLIILFIIITVCERVIGLVILINLIRLFDIDKYKLINFI